MTRRNRVILDEARAALAASGLNVPLVILLAMIKQEAPREPDAEDRNRTHLSNAGDGLLQVTLKSGNRRGQYGNTLRGIRNNLEDALQTLKGFLERSGGNLAKAVSRYNGGNDEDEGDPNYTQNVAKRITSGEVARNFGEEFAPEKLDDAAKAALKALQDYQRPKRQKK
ncbi:MAG TPA: hypothetical protein VFQ45_02300 [Longimicrobium sp.]|nr:hypothetical protein [Longimicrobium sp.]